MLGVGEEVLGRAFLDDLALVHEDDPVCHLTGKTHLVGDDQHRHTRPRQFLHGVEDLFDHLRVQCRGGFVEQHDLGVHGQRSRQGHTLLLATRQLAGILGGLLGYADSLQQRHGLGLRLALWPLADPGLGEGDVLKHRQMREQIE